MESNPIGSDQIQFEQPSAHQQPDELQQPNIQSNPLLNHPHLKSNAFKMGNMMKY